MRPNHRAPFLSLVIACAAMSLALGLWVVASGPSTAQAADAQADAVAASCAPSVPSSPTGAPSAVAGEVALLPASDLSGDRMYTLGDVAVVEEVGSLEVLEAWRGWPSPVPPPDGQASYTFLVRFSWDGTQPESQSIEMPSLYYNATGFTMRDDQGFQYPRVSADGYARTPALLFGELEADQSVQGWLTFHAPADASFVELVYAPIVDAPAFFRVMAP